MIYFMYLVIYLIAELCVENYSALVYPDENGRLVYQADSQGNVIPDFSNCGYKGGGVALPNVPVVKTVSPQAEGDDTERLQAAIDEVSALPMDGNGFRGALLLKRGEYRVEGTLYIRTSGVVLRGEGDDENGTVIIATSREYKVVLIHFKGSGNHVKVAGTRKTIVDDYVPVGARTFEVEDGSGFAMGNSVIVYRQATQAWIEELGMHEIPVVSGNEVPWKPGTYHMLFDRVVTEVNGNFVTLDAPLGNAIDHDYGSGWIYKYTFTGRIDQVGIENIRGVSVFDETILDNQGRFTDEEHTWHFVIFERVKNSWARNLTAVRFARSCVRIDKRCKWMTVQDSQFLAPVSVLDGGRRYSFTLDGGGQLILMQRLYAREGRHDFAVQARVLGPNAFVDCVAEKAKADSGPHARWSVATLFDNVITDDQINVQNRWHSGSGHGWAGAHWVLWNCEAEDGFAVHAPPTAQNYAIGCIGPQRNGKYWDDLDLEHGHWESHENKVYPRSLYYKQLEDRLGMDAVRAVATNEQIGRLLASKRVQSKIGQAQQGDFNRDGCIGFSDFLAFAAHYGLSEGQTGYNARYDLDGDKIIGFGDFLIFAAHFG